MHGNGVTKAVKYDRYGIFILPCLIGIITYYVTNFAIVKMGLEISPEDIADSYKLIVGIWATLLGFLVTAVSIFLTLGDTGFVSMLKKTGHYKTILLSYVTCCVHLLIAIIVCIFIIFLDISHAILFPLLCAITADAFVMITICLFFLFTLVIRIND
nr:hypothetical protein [uncultured Niameybacter sp.]